jgi:hypothetical protein
MTTLPMRTRPTTRYQPSVTDDYLSIPGWSDWPRKLSNTFARYLTARKYRPESHDIIFVRIFNRENEQVDPMVYLSHHGN